MTDEFTLSRRIFRLACSAGVALIVAAGCVALQPKISSWNLPDELPPCQERYRGKQAFLTAAGPYRDRIVMCFQEADGKYGYYEVLVKKVKR